VKIGILGGGQLGRMLALAGYPLGFSFSFFDPAPSSPAFPLGEAMCEPYGSSALNAFAQSVDVLTFEFENVPGELLEDLAARHCIRPSTSALIETRDRVREKTVLRHLGIPTAPWLDVPDLDAVRSAIASLGGDLILKTRTLGYDGKGQLRIRDGKFDESEVTSLLAAPCIAEGIVPFDAELSLVAVRHASGSCHFYPLIENEHREGILRISRVPSTLVTDALQSLAESYARRVLEHFHYVGVMTMELFLTNGSLAVNEIAPRVHNTGHWSIEGASTSQFENHLRAITDLPLGSCGLRGASVMVNLIGTLPPPAPVLALENVHLHLYGKAPRPGRKIGHITGVKDTIEEREHLLETLLKVLAH
jgi:5-(carboxyamino)imidazole ribonucleotide synthase